MKERTVLGQFVGKCCDANVVNNNDMHLGEKLFKNLFESEDYKRAMKNRHYVGYLGHPADIDCQDYEHACIVMTDCKLLTNGDVEGTFDLINTPVGKVVKAFTDAGVKFGISIRGAGDVDGNGEVDPDTFIFRGFDLVTFPAYNDCIPEFREIAASTDLNKQKTYKKVCASVNAELKNITSCEALEVVKEQFDEGSDEYNEVQNRIDELVSNEEEPAIIDKTDDEITQEVLEEKVDALTSLYVDAQNTIAQLEEDIVNTASTKDAEILQAKTQLKHYKRVVANQLKDASDSYNEQITANTKLRKQLQTTRAELGRAQQEIKNSRQLNLKYQRKIEATSNVVSERDSKLEEIEAQLNETVVANSELKRQFKQMSEDNSELNQRVEAAEKMLLEYQQAYANIYASALGRHVSNITVNSATSVKDLQSMINSSTNTSNIAPVPDVRMPEEEIFSDEEDDFIDDEIDDDTMYGGDLVTM